MGPPPCLLPGPPMSPDVPSLLCPPLQVLALKQQLSSVALAPVSGEGLGSLQGVFGDVEQTAQWTTCQGGTMWGW